MAALFKGINTVPIQTAEPRPLQLDDNLETETAPQLENLYLRAEASHVHFTQMP